MRASETFGCVTVAVASLTILAAPAAAQRQISTSIDEITVTAQKREENLQDVAISVSAMDAQAIEKRFARDLLDVTGMSPNLIIDPILGNGTAAISIRGMQLNDVEKSFDPAVAVYQDGIYLQTTTGALLNVWDAERIEVLRGPQGNLFGRNTIGGLVHVIRAKPTGELGGKVNVTVAEDEQLDVKATIDFPAIFNETLATKLSFVDQSGGGYFRNVTRNEDEGESNFRSYSASALWTPGDRFSLNLTYDRIDDQTPVRPVTGQAESPELFALLGFTAGENAPINFSDFHRQTFTSTDQDASVEIDALTANVELDLTDAHTLVGVFGWRDMEETSLQEFDTVSADVFRVSRPQFEDQTSFEVRLESDWSWGQSILGGFYWDSSYDAWQNTFFFGGFNDSPFSSQETESQAFFGQVDINLGERLTLSLGGRYTSEDKNYCQRFTSLPDPSGTPPADTTDFDGLPKVFDRSWGDCPVDQRGTYLTTFTDPVTGQTREFTGVESWSEFTPRIGLSYDTDAGMIYATYSEGFRSGGFNGRNTAPANAGPYEPETVESIEVGAKTTWMDDRLQLNVSLFNVDYTDKQEDVVFPGTDGAVTLTLVQNAGAATIRGLEIETVFIPADGFTVGLNVGAMDAEYDEFSIVDPTGLPLDKSNFDLRRAPDLTAALNLLHEYELSNGNFLVTSLNYAWKDEYWVGANTDYTTAAGVSHYTTPPGLNPAHGLLDLSMTYETENWAVSVFGRNLTDEAVTQHFLDVAAAYNATSPTNPTPQYVPGLWSFATVSRPRWFGGEFRLKF